MNFEAAFGEEFLVAYFARESFVADVRAFVHLLCEFRFECFSAIVTREATLLRMTRHMLLQRSRNFKRHRALAALVLPLVRMSRFVT